LPGFFLLTKIVFPHSSNNFNLHADAAKSKKKQLEYTPIQMQALKVITDGLKLMTVWQEVAFMAAELNLLPALVELLDSPELTLRHNAHLIIGAASTHYHCQLYYRTSRDA
jgi:hypothetical protein